MPINGIELVVNVVDEHAFEFFAFHIFFGYPLSRVFIFSCLTSWFTVHGSRPCSVYFYSLLSTSPLFGILFVHLVQSICELSTVNCELFKFSPFQNSTLSISISPGEPSP